MGYRYTGISGVSGAFSATLNPVAVTGTGVVSVAGIVGTFSSTLNPVVMTGVGTTNGVTGAFSATLNPVSLSATGQFGTFTSTNLASITFSPTITGTSLPVTFGHVFKEGDVPSGTSVEALGLTTQFNVLSTHADGSARHASLTVVTNTSAGVPQIVTLRTRLPTSNAAITKSQILSTVFDASASLVVSGTTYLMTARELLAGTTTPLQNVTHIAGPYCTEYIVGAKLRTSGGTQHNHLAAYFHVRAYSASGNGVVNRIRCDVVVENGWTFVAGSNAITSAVTIAVAGSTVFSSGSYVLYHHTKIYASGWYGTNPQVTYKHDSAYLLSTKAVPNYGTGTLKEALLSTFSATYSPGGTAGLRSSWGGTGDHYQIGIMPEWDASYVVSGDIRALNSSIAASKAGGSFSFHYRDENTGFFPSIDTYPTISEQGYSGGLIQGAGGTAYSHDEGADASAHAPLLGYLAYLCTSDYIHLEALLSQTNYFMLWNSTSRRTYLTGPQDGIVGLQNRGQAWAIRNLGAAAYITPDAHPQKTYFTNKLANNINQKTASWASPSKNIFGAIQDYDWLNGVPPKYTPFENDFFLTSFGWLVDLGFTSATTMRNWLSKFQPGRLGQDASGYCPYYSMPYKWDAGVSPTPTGDTFYSTWAALYAANYPTESASQCPAGLISGSYQDVPSIGDFTHGFYSNMKPALAYSVDSGVASLATWKRFVSYGTNDYTYSPRYNIVPRALASLPAGYLAQPSGTWREFTGKLASAVDPCPSRTCNYSGTEGFAAIMDSWSSAIYDSKRDRLIFWGGGHNAYYGNEQIVFDLITETWSRLTNPSSVPSSDKAPPNLTTYYSDGKPASRHPYNVPQYDPIRDQLISGYAAATAGETGGQSPACDVYNYATGAWSIKANAPTPGADPYGMFAAVDASGNYWIAYWGFSTFNKFNPANNTWTAYSASYNYSGGPYCTAAIDTLRNRFVAIGSGHFTKTSLATPTSTTAVGGSPPGALLSAQGPGWVYDPIGDRFIGWVGGQTLHAVDAATLTNWTTLTTSGATPPDSSMAGNWRGTNGKFRYSPNLHGLILAVQTFYPPYFYKL